MSIATPQSPPIIRSPVDLTIIGGGPVGLYAAFYAGMRKMSVRVVDSLDSLGGQLVALYPEKYIYDVAGFPKILARQLTQQLAAQGLQFGAETCLGERVLRLEADSAARQYVVTTDKSQHPTKAVLIAAGIGSFRPKQLAVPDADRYVGRGVYYAVKEIEAFRNKRVLIVGGGDSAVDWANTLAPLAASVTLIHRRDEFRAHEESVEQMLAGPTRVMTFHELAGLEGDDVHTNRAAESDAGHAGHPSDIRRAIVVDNRTKVRQVLDVDAVLVNIGFVSTLGPIADWGLTIQHNAIVVDSTMQTNRPGIFAAGDVVTYPGKLKLISVGFGEAAIAANNAKRFVDPAARVYPGHSSELSL